MTAPWRLRRGNAFQEIVQADFIANTHGGGVEREVRINFGLISANNRRTTGRVDIWVDDNLLDGAIAVYGIKATDWYLIAPRNVRRNIYRHQKQLLEYVHKYLFVDNLKVTYGLIYPCPPKRAGLRDEVENLAMLAYHVPVYWYNELNDGFNPVPFSI